MIQLQSLRFVRCFLTLNVDGNSAGGAARSLRCVVAEPPSIAPLPLEGVADVSGVAVICPLSAARILVGDLTLVGPGPGQSLACFLGRRCLVEVRGVELAAGDTLHVQDRCGGETALPGLTSVSVSESSAAPKGSAAPEGPRV